MRILGLELPELIVIAALIAIVVIGAVISKQKSNGSQSDGASPTPPDAFTGETSQANAANTQSAFNDQVAEELRGLKELFDAGIITQEEYEQKKKELLGI